MKNLNHVFFLILRKLLNRANQILIKKYLFILFVKKKFENKAGFFDYCI